MESFLLGAIVAVLLLCVFARPIGRWLERQTDRLNRLSERIEKRR